ncbi:cilia- and flagella-associated protein 100-like [Bicyclus anynana]|uniref:Cilia- and flagella-associated protein 100-like n=1 Tax=Bicyclus anynana TaxID=110368 RepID=A0A6J1N0G8_BICAN|nr:cilia- and flagella-associated protein 100-like [Bicyclus anynana]
MLNEEDKPLTISTCITKKRRYSDKLLVSSSHKQNDVTKKKCSKLPNDDLKKYILPNNILLSIAKLKKPEFTLPLKYYCKQQDRDQFKRKLTIGVSEKYKIVSADLRKRLYVSNPVNDINSDFDVDADYYRYLDGRPLQLHNPGFKSFRECVKQILHLKYEVGIKRDGIFNLETNYRNELDIYSLSVKRLTDQAKYFDAFISEDYKKSMEFLAKWDKLKFQVDSKIKELQATGTEQFSLKSRLIGLEYKYSVQLKYGRFLYYLSPPIWRLNNREFARSVEIEAKGFDYGNSHDEDTFAILFEKMRKICYGNTISPALYFTQANDLMTVFNEMENQQLYYYTHISHLVPLIKMLKEEIKSLKEVILQEYAMVASLIKKYEILLSCSEERCTELELKFYKILFGFFYNTVGVPDFLKLVLHLEFCYEKIFQERPINIDITVIAKSIEIFYMDYSKQLDEIRSNTVRRAMLKCEETERLKVEKAKLAAKELRLFHRLERELLRAYGIAADRVYTPIKKKCGKNKRKLTSTSSNKLITKQKESKSLTDVEFEYLRLFTDWTENEDPVNCLQSYV